MRRFGFLKEYQTKEIEILEELSNLVKTLKGVIDRNEMADVFDFELHEAHTDGNDSDDVRKCCSLQEILKCSLSPSLVPFMFN